MDSDTIGPFTFVTGVLVAILLFAAIMLWIDRRDKRRNAESFSVPRSKMEIVRRTQLFGRYVSDEELDVFSKAFLPYMTTASSDEIARRIAEFASTLKSDQPSGSTP